MKPSTPLVLLGGYLLARAALGALLNPPLNGPDEGGHLQYLQTLIATGGRHVTGVESRQPPTYYLLAALPWLAAQGAGAGTQLFFVRLLGGLCGQITLAAAWAAARIIWPGRPALALATAAVATLAPGYLFLLASANNDQLATGFASLAVVAALRLWGRSTAPPAPRYVDELIPGSAGILPASDYRPPNAAAGGTPALPLQADRTGRQWLLGWIMASLAALATKLTAAPLVLALAGALLVHRREVIFRPWWTRALAGLAALALLAGYGVLLSRPPTTSLAASAARFWPLALLRAPVAYISLGGLAESFRTFWYAYDYAVRWPPPVEAALAGSAAAVTITALVGLMLNQVQSAKCKVQSGAAASCQCGAGAARPRVRLPWLVWAAAGVQVALVVARYGLGDLLRIEMGGAGQAKAFFPALLPLSLLFVAGLAAVARRLQLRDERWLALGVFGWLVGLDAISLAVTTWQQYRWWQGGP